MNICLVTGNENKAREFEEILGFKLGRANLDLEEIQSVQVEKVIINKTKQAFGIIGKPVIAEDTGLYFDSWNGLPGALAKLFDKTIGYRKLCGLLGSERGAKAQTVVGYFDGNDYRSFIGEINGTIAESPRGKNGFGWDMIFIPEGHSKTFAEMENGEKNRVSMRKIALEKLRNFLKDTKRT